MKHNFFITKRLCFFFNFDKIMNCNFFMFHMSHNDLFRKYVYFDSGIFIERIYRRISTSQLMLIPPDVQIFLDVSKEYFFQQNILFSRFLFHFSHLTCC